MEKDTYETKINVPKFVYMRETDKHTERSRNKEKVARGWARQRQRPRIENNQESHSNSIKFMVRAWLS